MLVEELAKQFALKIVHEKEAVLMQLLNERLGNNWTVDSLNGLLQCKVQLDQEIYYLDEKPLVKFVTTIFPIPEGQMKSEVSYRVLGIGGKAQTENEGERRQQDREFIQTNTRSAETRWRNGWGTSPRVCRVDDGLPNRVDRCKSLGNAIVPQVAYEILRCIRDV